MDDGTTGIFEHDQDKVAGHFDRTSGNQYETASERIGWDGVVEQLVDQVKQRVPEELDEVRIADLGTGPDAYSAGFLAKAFEGKTEIHGLDVSKKSLKDAIKDEKITTGIPHPISEVSKHVGGMTEYDAVTVSGVLDFVKESEMPDTVREIGMMLKKGGILAMTIEPTGAENPGVNANQHDPASLKELLNAHGITNIEMTPTSYKAWGSAAKNGQDTIETMIITGIKTEDPDLGL